MSEVRADDTDEKSAAVVRRLRETGYGHGPNLLFRLRQLEQIMDPDLAVEVVFDEIVGPD